ncbi:ROK family transcriptional regulator [Arthrobacter sp. ES1]|uniref:ROK family transcriptional regulator n=1 Tax=Arthrobacter sp. ES1 TaxID=1897056 RepID=UPI001D000407|nr:MULTISPECIES: ROK family transcriptional regulator [Micrococcaceae]MDJ0354024.1 ROK family transcriptional regulator [Pseudarthrobacter sp. PH31-O2]WGZ81343.1 ROK family transcriptional regulator [Arthrobacter sp. EM1]
MRDDSLQGRPTTSGGFPLGRTLRPRSKVLPEHARGHNRALVLQTLYGLGSQSRADVARVTGLTRVTVSDLVAELIDEGLVIELGQRTGVRPGKPATLLDINRGGFQIVGIDLSDNRVFRGAMLDLDGKILSRAEIALENSTGAEATAKAVALAELLITQATATVIGIGVGSPGIVDLEGVVLSAPNLGWENERLRAKLSASCGLPVVVSNDANVAVFAEHSFGEAKSDIMLIRIGHGLGSGILLGGRLLFGSRFAAGEIGHVVFGSGGDECVCGKRGCLETWLAVPRIEARLATASTEAERAGFLWEAGERLGAALAPVVGALNLAEVVLSGPRHLLEGPLFNATLETLHRRTMSDFDSSLTVRMTTLGEDIVMRGAAVLVLSRELGVS